MAAAEKMAAALALLQWYRTDQDLCECAALGPHSPSISSQTACWERMLRAQNLIALLLADDSHRELWTQHLKPAPL